MKFWDSSAIVPLLLKEKASASLSKALEKDMEMIVWSLSSLECLSAFYRLERTGVVPVKMISVFQERLNRLRGHWTEVQQLGWVRNRAERLLASHSLKAADSCQLAAALVACEDRPELLEFVTLDEQLARAASREGFRVIGFD